MLRKRMSPARRSTPTPEARPCELPLTILRDRSVPVLRPHAGRPSGEVRERQQLGYLRLLRRAQHTSSRLLRALWIGTNAVIVGGIEIGDDVLIAPGAFVNVDVPSGSTVIGNPGVVHLDHPCPSEYVQNPWEGPEP